MLLNVVKFLGLDLQEQAGKLKTHAEQFRDATVSKVSDQVEYTGITLGFAFAGGLLAAGTIVIGFIAVYRWVAIQYDPMTALAVTAVGTAIAAAIMFSIAAARGSKKPRPMPLPAVAPPPQAAAKASAPPPASPAPSVSAILSSSVPPPPANASILDVVTHRVTTRAAAASDEAVDAAVHFIRSGSRNALIGTLVATAVVGWLVGRRTPN